MYNLNLEGGEGERESEKWTGRVGKGEKEEKIKKEEEEGKEKYLKI